MLYPDITAYRTEAAQTNTNGIWTGHDWTDDTNGIKVIDGIP